MARRCAPRPSSRALAALEPAHSDPTSCATRSRLERRRHRRLVLAANVLRPWVPRPPGVADLDQEAAESTSHVTRWHAILELVPGDDRRPTVAQRLPSPRLTLAARRLGAAVLQPTCSGAGGPQGVPESGCPRCQASVAR